MFRDLVLVGSTRRNVIYAKSMIICNVALWFVDTRFPPSASAKNIEELSLVLAKEIK